MKPVQSGGGPALAPQPVVGGVQADPAQPGRAQLDIGQPLAGQLLRVVVAARFLGRVHHRRVRKVGTGRFFITILPRRLDVYRRVQAERTCLRPLRAEQRLAAIDLLADKLDRLLIKHRKKQVDHHRGENAARDGSFG